jgi:hypothetical protein
VKNLDVRFLRKISCILVMFLYFLIIIFGPSSFYLQGGISVKSSLLDLSQANGEWDWRYLAYFTESLKAGTLESGDLWIARLWPPGMPLVNFILAVVTGSGNYFVLRYLVLLTILWALIIFLTFKISKNAFQILLVSLVWILVFNSNVYNFHLLGSGRLYSEGLGTGFLILGYLTLFAVTTEQNSAKYKKVLYMFSIVALSIAVYIRAVNDLIVIFWSLGITFYLGFLKMKLRNLKSHRKLQYSNSKSLRIQIGEEKLKISRNIQRYKQVLLVLLVIQLICLPWRALVFTVISPGSLTFASATNQMWINQWVPTDRYADGPWTNEFGANGFCQSYTERCIEISKLELTSNNPYSGQGFYSSSTFRSFAIESLYDNPIPWLENRVKFHAKQTLKVTEGILLPSLNSLISILCFFYFMLRNLKSLVSKNFYNSENSILLIGVLVMSIMPSYFGQFETRYLVYGYVYLLLSVVTSWSRESFKN